MPQALSCLLVAGIVDDAVFRQKTALCSLSKEHLGGWGGDVDEQSGSCIKTQPLFPQKRQN